MVCAGLKGFYRLVFQCYNRTLPCSRPWDTLQPGSVSFCGLNYYPKQSRVLLTLEGRVIISHRFRLGVFIGPNSDQTRPDETGLDRRLDNGGTWTKNWTEHDSAQIWTIPKKSDQIQTAKLD